MQDDLRVVDLTRIKAVEGVIDRHLPSLTQEVEVLSSPVWKQKLSSLHAGPIVDAAKRASLNFGASPDVEMLEKVERLCRKLDKALDALSPDTRRYIEFEKIAWRERNSTSILASCKDQLGRLGKAVGALRNRKMFQATPHQKRNWRAASVAQECRKVWAVGNWSGPLFLARPPDEEERYQQHLRDFAPKHEKDATPGPFGRFLEDVLEVLEVEGAKGEIVSAASALRAWREAPRDE
ncbi:hypothetical protein [Rubellimicrobium roseum]|uniref:Uncharacterized protein n=1 Tax=Rubellimicrobium roseum TaxID=687525 RepID=A0A5C4N576_9RHOB|nr:hypothetical protein [Rubellimicrobium roseum]TNC61326.1 hypothetical protein FHG71_21315 [Rubellimicrobium roseum]